MTVQNCTVIGNSYLQGVRGVASAVVRCTNVGLSGGAIFVSVTSQTTCSADTPTFVDADNDDFHLAAGDTTWKNAGTDLSATFTTDIDSETRTAPWDIGADQYIASFLPTKRIYIRKY
jgi:hypothetical protein